MSARSSSPSRQMAQPQFLIRLRAIHWDPAHWARMCLQTFGKALTRLWGRDVMLYVGGVSFFSMLAIFPALALLKAATSAISLSKSLRAIPINFNCSS